MLKWIFTLNFTCSHSLFTFIKDEEGNTIRFLVFHYHEGIEQLIP